MNTDIQTRFRLRPGYGATSTWAFATWNVVNVSRMRGDIEGGRFRGLEPGVALIAFALTRSRPLARSPCDLWLRHILFAASQVAQIPGLLSATPPGFHCAARSEHMHVARALACLRLDGGHAWLSPHYFGSSGGRGTTNPS
jgi:hypothetical protein